MSVVADLLARLDQMRTRRDPWLSLWQDLGEVFLPDRANFTVMRAEGERNIEDIYDGSPRLAARDLSSAIDGLLKPKTTNWFDLTLDDEDLAEQEEVRRWFENARERMWRAIYNPEAGFVSRSGETDCYLTVFGWGALWCLENKQRNGLLFKTQHIKDVYLDEDADGNVDCIAVQEELTPRQALNRFGPEKLHKNIKDCLIEGGAHRLSKKFPFAQIVMPREDYDAKRIGGPGLAYKSIVMDVANEQVMSEGGFHEFPCAVPRWDTAPGGIYARSPAMLALPDALTLQAMGKTLLIGGERAADPPIMVPSDGFVTPIRTFPGAVSVYDVQAIADGKLSQPFFPFPVSSNLPVGREMQADYRFQVQQAFFKNVLNLPIERAQMTATEILERKEEFIRVLGPIFGRLENDYIGAIVRRVFGIMERAGAFGPRPEPLADQAIRFRFQSPVQTARKAIEVAGFARTIEIMTPLSTFQPEIFDNIDGDKVIREAPEFAGIPSGWLRSEKDVAEARQSRADQQGNMAAAEGGPALADTIKKLAEAGQIAGEPAV